MITGELKSQIDRIWNDFWTGGISNPLTVIEQFTYLIFLKQLDDKQILIEKEKSVFCFIARWQNWFGAPPSYG